MEIYDRSQRPVVECMFFESVLWPAGLRRYRHQEQREGIMPAVIGGSGHATVERLWGSLHFAERMLHGRYAGPLLETRVW